MFHNALVERIELLRFDGHIDRTPMHGVRRRLVVHDELVFWRTARPVGVADNCAIGRKLRLVPPDGMFHQHCQRKIEVGSTFAQQLGNVADVHGGRHENLLGSAENESRAKTFYSASKTAGLPRNRITHRLFYFTGTILWTRFVKFCRDWQTTQLQSELTP